MIALNIEANTDADVVASTGANQGITATECVECTESGTNTIRSLAFVKALNLTLCGACASEYSLMISERSISNNLDIGC